MANICKYSMRIKGLENVAMLIAETTPCYNNKNIHTVSVEDNVCILEVNGDCKWSARDSLIELKGVIPNDLDLESRLNEVDEEIMDVLCDVSILEKSNFFKCEVEITTKSTHSEFAEWWYIKDGEIIKKDISHYRLFVWDKNEYEVYEDWEEDEGIDEMRKEGLELSEEDFENTGDGIYTCEYNGYEFRYL